MENDRIIEDSSLMGEYINKRISNSLTKRRKLCLVRKVIRRLILVLAIVVLTASMAWNVYGIFKLFEWIFN
jgi:hypothetical protein